jgi:uncharacterized protein YjgD (DUF1641 family)
MAAMAILSNPETQRSLRFLLAFAQRLQKRSAEA